MLEELFKTHPFVYDCDGDYYVIGEGICWYCSDSGMVSDFNKFKKDKNEKLFKKFYAKCDQFRDTYGYNQNADEEFTALSLSKGALEDIESQLNDYSTMMKKTGLK